MSPYTKRQMTIEDINLSGVQKRLQTKEGFDIRRAENTIEMYRRFLKIVQSNPTEIMVPNEDVDTAWHHHILDTQAYIRDCQTLFGQYLHHNPHFYGTDAFFEACDNTQAIYSKKFEGNTFVSSVLKAAECGGMLKDEGDMSLKPSECGGMLKDDGNVSLKPSECGGMLKDDGNMSLKPSECGGMLKDDGDMGLKPSECGGMLKDESELEAIGRALPAALAGAHLTPDALFKPYVAESSVH